MIPFIAITFIGTAVPAGLLDESPPSHRSLRLLVQSDGNAAAPEAWPAPMPERAPPPEGRQPFTRAATAEEQLARLEKLLATRRDLVQRKPGLGAPVGFLVGSVLAAPVAVLFLNLSAPGLQYVGSGSGGWAALGAGIIVFLFAVGVIAAVAHVVLGVFFGVTLPRRIRAREDADAEVKRLDEEIQSLEENLGAAR